VYPFIVLLQLDSYVSLTLSDFYFDSNNKYLSLLSAEYNLYQFLIEELQLWGVG
jgi:hypothetical protein